MDSDRTELDAIASEAEHRALFPEHGESAQFDNINDPLTAASADEELRIRLQEVKDEIATLKARLHVVLQQSGTLLSANIRWIDASAHEQLGAYPWLKISGAAFAAFLTGRLIRRLPVGLLAFTAKPLLLTAITMMQPDKERRP